ncbi:MAG TPA: arylsulfatase [Bryobacteraceae bacterium]|nr:arylsulfatase [Bryobacteraceae bacterium]
MTAERVLSRRQLLRTAGAGVAPILANRNEVCAAQRRSPNIVFFLADDQGWGDLSIHGNKNLSTAHIDSIASDGALFDRFYVCAVCAPTRAELLTGRYHSRCGVRGVSTGAERLNLDEKTIADTFKSAGYATGAFGKWHNGSQFPYHPNARGFEEYYGFTSGHWGHYFDPELDHNGKLVRGKGYITDDLTNHALDFIAQHRKRPFFCYLPFNTPHAPMQVPERWFEKFSLREPQMRARNPQQEEIPMTRAALAMCENIDWNVGRVLAKLDELGLRDNTIVIYSSDNGPNSWRWNGGMKGRKGSVDEGGVRAPFLIRYPRHIRSGTRISRIAGAIDLLPTLADMCGVPVNSTKPLDGRSLRPLLLGETKQWPDRMIFSLQNRRISVRTQQYRLDAAGQLFDMIADPGQDRNIAEERPEVAAKLRQAVAEWGREMLPLVGPDDRPFPVGYSRITLLPARDGVPEGGVERSAKPPNCSYFTHWTSRDDRMTWDIEIAYGGDYDVDIYYTCAAEDLGSTVELSFMNNNVRKRITEAHDPPLVGAAEDRVPRGESYVKDFRPLRIGSLAMKKGRGKLSLRATEIPGKHVADVRRIALTRRGV